jgi:hypothetical protein
MKSCTFFHLAVALMKILSCGNSNVYQENQLMATQLKISNAGHKNKLSVKQPTTGLSV